MTTLPPSHEIPAERRIYCNRTLNFRSIKVLGFDMDYTLVHYKTEFWEGRAFEYTRERLAELGHPVEGLRFVPDFAEMGLIIDQRLGNLVKANRFGHVRRACHGTRVLDHLERKAIYQTAPIELSETRWQFMNTLFSLSEASIYMQMVDLLDAGKLPEVRGYADLYRLVKSCLDAAHVEGELKAEIQANPEAYVVLDDALPQALLDQKQAGKKLVVITNSEWEYTRSMLSYTLDRYLPDGMKWRDLFDLVIVQAGKPGFFAGGNLALELAQEEGLFRPHVGPLCADTVYLGANARLVEESLGVQGDEVLYFGDHIYADVHVSKELLRWRTGLVARELERELAAVAGFSERQVRLSALMHEKDALEQRLATLRLDVQRAERHPDAARLDIKTTKHEIRDLRKALSELDDEIAPLAHEADAIVNRNWGPSMRCGNDKSHLARQIERYADIYTSRVSNIGAYTPFAYLRAQRGSLPHDP
jgi:5'-nucleotidase